MCQAPQSQPIPWPATMKLNRWWKNSSIGLYPGHESSVARVNKPSYESNANVWALRMGKHGCDRNQLIVAAMRLSDFTFAMKADAQRPTNVPSKDCGKMCLHAVTWFCLRQKWVRFVQRESIGFQNKQNQLLPNRDSHPFQQHKGRLCSRHLGTCKAWQWNCNTDPHGCNMRARTSNLRAARGGGVMRGGGCSNLASP